MDFHPIIVHFPIGLLTVYTILELIRPWTKASSWKHVRAVFVILGTVFAFVALSTGEVAEHLFQDRSLHDVLEMHSLIATTTTWIYAVLAVAYLAEWMEHAAWLAMIPQSIRSPLLKLLALLVRILHSPFAYMFAVLAFLGLILAGALGAILVYGPEFDPITSLVYKLLF